MQNKCTYIRRSELDEIKYNACIENADNSLIYALSRYLDIVCDRWDCMVLDDYTMVMPLPRRKKMGIHYIYLPAWVQQLGIFYRQNLSAEIAMIFLKAIPKKFFFTEIYFNAKNDFYPINLKKRVNYVLSFYRSYESLKRYYTKGRVSAIANAKKLGLICRDSSGIDQLIDIHKEFYKDKNERNPEDLRRLKELFLQLSVLKMATLRLIFENEHLLGGAVFLNQQGRSVYLFSAVSESGRQKQAISFLLDDWICIHAGNNIVFDFEGSMVENIASFFRSFGAEKEIYYHYTKSVISFPGNNGKKEKQIKRK